MFFKLGALKISQISQENSCVGVSFKQPSGMQLCQKETPKEVLSCEICEIFKSILYRNNLVASK